MSEGCVRDRYIVMMMMMMMMSEYGNGFVLNECGEMVGKVWLGG